MNRKDEDSFIIRHNFKWVLFISFWTFIMSVVVSIITENLMNNLDILAAFFVLVIIIMIGIVFDIIGIAVTTAEEKPFHAMAANKVGEARFAIKLVRNAGQVSNFCNDVIGDISSILSGAAGTTIIYKLINRYGLTNGTLFTIVITSLIASFTVGGKAFGKSIAMYNYENIIYRIAKWLSFIEKKTGIDIFPNKKKNKKK